MALNVIDNHLESEDGNPCVWKYTVELNQKGIGTTFTDGPTKYTQKCFDCKGYDTGRDCYLPMTPRDSYE